MSDLSKLRLALYGGGKMGFAMLEGWLGQGLANTNVAVFDPHPSTDVEAAGVLINPEHFEADVIVLAVKPQIMSSLLETTEFDDKAMIVSVAAGLPIAFFENSFGSNRPIIRTMPNTPAAVGAGITALIGNAAVNETQLSLAEELMQAVGQTVRLEKEADMDAVTAVSGSGPAYVFHMIEALRSAGEAEGLTPELAHKLALATVAGAGKLALESGADPATLRENVTSPGGTTAAGLSVLMDEDSGLCPLMAASVAAAANRSRELGK